MKISRDEQLEEFIYDEEQRIAYHWYRSQEGLNMRWCNSVPLVSLTKKPHSDCYKEDSTPLWKCQFLLLKDGCNEKCQKQRKRFCIHKKPNIFLLCEDNEKPWSERGYACNSYTNQPPTFIFMRKFFQFALWICEKQNQQSKNDTEKLLNK